MVYINDLSDLCKQFAKVCLLMTQNYMSMYPVKKTVCPYRWDGMLSKSGQTNGYWNKIK